MAEVTTGSPDAREWAGDPPWPVLGTAEAGQPIVACYYVEAVEQALTRHQKPYLRLRLFDRHGPVDARVWDDAERVADRILPRSFVGIRGRVEVFNDRRQLKIEEIAPVRVSAGDLGLFLPRSRRDPDAMAAELDTVVASISEPPLRTLLERLLGGASEIGRRFRSSPAAKRKHHACVGGLLEHTLSVVGVCEALARHYGAPVDRDLLLAGALLHDIGKTHEIGAELGFPYTDEGKLLGHILLGLRLVREEARDVPDLGERRLLLLLHLIASHQGRYEWQSPREPRVLEALLLHHADDLDAKMCQAFELVQTVGDGWTRYDRTFSGELFRHVPGVAHPTGAEERRGVDAAEVEPRAPATEPAVPGARAPAVEAAELEVRTPATGAAEAARAPAMDAAEAEGRRAPVGAAAEPDARESAMEPVVGPAPTGDETTGDPAEESAGEPAAGEEASAVPAGENAEGAAERGQENARDPGHPPGSAGPTLDLFPE